MARTTAPIHLVGLLLGVVLGSVLTSSEGAAANINVPPLTITELQHNVFPATYRDEVTIPGTGYTTSGFSAAIATGDVVTVRIQAPAGKRFVLDRVTDGQFFTVDVVWAYGGFGTTTYENPHVVTFENFKGTMPTQTYSLVSLGDSRQDVRVVKNYSFSAPFEFTAMRIDITDATAHTPVAFNYSLLGRSFGAGGIHAGPLNPIMRIADISTPVERTSWGRVKALYR